MDHAATLKTILSSDPLLCRALALVHTLQLPDCWIGAGLLRNAVWDRLHGLPASLPAGDVDVIWFLPDQTDAEDQKFEKRLERLDPMITWSVKNQARMHLRNGDAAYSSAIDAMRYWPETATAVAARQTEGGTYEIAAPFGLDDLFGLMLKPTPRFVGDKHRLYLNRVRSKQWLERWPLLRT